jgi:hypothetical protein
MSEGDIVGDNHTAVLHGGVENPFVRRTDETFIRHGPDVAAALGPATTSAPMFSSVRRGKANGFTP